MRAIKPTLNKIAKTGTKYSVTEELSPPYAYQVKITQLLSQLHIDLPPDWSWCWQTNRGKMPRRLRAIMTEDAYHDHFHDLMQAAATSMARPGLYDVTFALDWQPGDYGESKDSCYWWMGKLYLRALAQNGYGAVRQYNGDGKGIGRAWIGPDVPQKGYIVCFNGYLKHDAVPHKRFAAALAQIVGFATGKAYTNSAAEVERGDDTVGWFNTCDVSLIYPQSEPHIDRFILSIPVHDEKQ